MTWPVPELDAGAEPADCSPLDDELCELPAVPELLAALELPDTPELRDALEPDVAWLGPAVADPEDVWAVLA